MEVSDSLGVVKGFRASGVDAGLRRSAGKQSAPDLALIVSDEPCAAAGVFTTNAVRAAPVTWDENVLWDSAENVRAVLVNAACANACTGGLGSQNARQTAVWTANALGCTPDNILLMSTGVIGVQLPMPEMESGIPVAIKALKADGWNDASTAIMTTDTRPKRAFLKFNGGSMAGIAKGAGMIAPNMATLLSVVATDFAISPDLLQDALATATEASFNRIVIDGDMSTNDTLLVLASGASGVTIDEYNGLLPEFVSGLTAVCTSLAQGIVRDGEGVTKFITLHIKGAASVKEARQIGNTIAISPLVKTAFYGGDANWGRIMMAAGRAGLLLEQNKLALWYDDLQLVAHGAPLDYDGEQANAIARQPEVTVTLDLGMGDQQTTIWTCDLSHDYVSINGHYRT